MIEADAENIMDRESEVAAKLRAVEAERSLRQILGRIPTIEFHGFDMSAGELISPRRAWAPFIRHDARPDYRIDRDAPARLSGQWLLEALREFDFDSTVLLSVGGLAGLPWSKVLFKAQSSSVIELWKLPNVSEFLIYDWASERICAIIEDEYSFEATVRRVAEIVKN